MPDSLSLGIGIQFDSSTLNQLNQLLSYIQKIQKKFDDMENPLKKSQKTFQDINDVVNRVNDNAGKLVKTQTAINNSGSKLVKVYEDIHGNVTKVTSAYNSQNQLINQSVSKTALLKNSFDEITRSIGNAISKMLLWVGAGTLLFGTVRGLQDAFQTMIKLESSAVNIAKVLPNPNKLSMAQLVKPFEESDIQLAKKYGQSLLDVEMATANWAKQYKTVGEVIVATNASILAATSTDITFEGSVKDLSAILAEWSLQAKDSIRIVNILNEESNSYRITAQGLAEALAKSSSAAKVLGLSMEELAGIATVGIQTLGIEGNQMGTILTRLFARIRGNDSAIKALKDLGVDAMAPLSTLLTELSIKWGTMTDGEKQNIAITIGGSQHWSRLIGLLDNYGIIISATAKAYDSMGSAEKEVNNVLATTEKHIQQLNATWQEYIYRNNGVLTITKNIVDMLRNLVTGLAQFNPLVVVAGIVALTFVFKAWFAQIVATNAALSTTTLMLLSNPWTAAIASIIAVAGALIIMGNNANRAQNQILEMQSKLAQFDTLNDGLINKSKGIIDLANKYEIYQKAIEKAKSAGQDYSKITDLFNVAQSELAKAIGVNNAELDILIKKDGGIRAFMENRLKENAALINSEREKANAIKLSTKAKLEEELKPLQNKLKKQQEEVEFYKKQASMNLNNPTSYAFYQSGQLKAQNQVNILGPMVKDMLEKVSGIKIDTYVTKLEDFYTKPTGTGLDTTTDKPLKDSATITDFTKQFIDMIVTAGQKWDEAVNKSIKDPERKLQPRDMLISYLGDQGFATQSANLSSEAWSKFQSFANEAKNTIDNIGKLGEKIQDVDKPYKVAQDKLLLAGKQFEGSTEQLSAKEQILGNIDNQLSTLDEYKKKMEELKVIFGDSEVILGALNAIEQLRNNLLDKQSQFGINLTNAKKPGMTYQQGLDEYYTGLSANAAKNAEALEKSANTIIENSKKRSEGDLLYLSNQLRAIPGMEYIADQLEKLYQSQIFNNVFASSIKSVANALTELGNGARFFGEALNIAANAYDVETGKFDFKADLANIITTLINETIAVFAQTKKDMEQYLGQASKFGKNTNTSVNSTGNAISNYANYDANKQEYMRLVMRLQQLDSTNVFGINNAKIEEVKKQLDALSGSLTNVLGQLTEALGVSVSNIASSLESAFQADNYMGFLTSWNNSLYEMTRSALIKGFLASETVQPLMKGLSQTIALSAVDGMITGQELLDIKAASNALQPMMQNLYSALSVLDTGMIHNGNGAGSQGGQQTFTAGSSSNITINIYSTIEAGIFWGDPEQARTAAIEIGNLYAEEMGRA
jgi:TP901 family phage tail tape measure protein